MVATVRCRRPESLAMLCIPTLVALTKDDPELARAQAALADRLRPLHAMALGTGVAPPLGAWQYLASTPFREDDGVIVYVHVFHAGSAPDGSPHAIGIPSSEGWWPVGQSTLNPRRTMSRAQLRLVS
jgi:hypothetical protein